jgi:hypothetical protein
MSRSCVFHDHCLPALGRAFVAHIACDDALVLGWAVVDGVVCGNTFAQRLELVLAQPTVVAVRSLSNERNLGPAY